MARGERGKRRGWSEEPRPTRGDRHGDPARPEAWGEELGGLPAFGQGRLPGQGPARDAGWWRDDDRASAAESRFSGPRGYSRPDDRILEDCWRRLAADPDLDSSRVELRVEQGLVRLGGEVHSRFEKLRAEDLCASIRGVEDVHNRLRVVEPE